jgi:signal transduction histidine kinase
VAEHPGEHDVAALARRFGRGTDGEVVLVDARARPLDPGAGSVGALPGTLRAALQRALQGGSSTGTHDGDVFAAEPIGTGPDHHGALVVAQSDAAAMRRIHQLWLALGVIAAVALAAAALVGDRLALWAIRPLRRLDERAAALGRGDLAARADPGAGPPEVTELAGTFNEMAARIEELVGSQRRFVADASHQLRSPLTALRLRLDAIDPADPVAAAADIDAAVAETRRLSRLVDGLLALTRAEAVDVAAGGARQAIDVAAVVAERREAWSALAEERGVELRAELPDGPVPVSLVEGHLDQILDNLIDNAVDATPRGRAVTLTVTRAPDAVEIHVVDQGPGMTAEDRAHAFERFWQGPGRSAGSGLGLPIVAQLVRVNRGEARLDPTPGGGVDAVVRMPRPE